MARERPGEQPRGSSAEHEPAESPSQPQLLQQQRWSSGQQRWAGQALPVRLAAEAINCSLRARGAFGWAHCSPGLEKAQGYGRLQWRSSPPGTHACILLGSSSQAAWLPSRAVPPGSPPLALPLQPAPRQGSAFLLPHHRDFFGACGGRFISDAVPAGSPFFWGLCMC